MNFEERIKQIGAAATKFPRPLLW